MKILENVLCILDEVLSLNGRAVSTFDRKTPLIGALPELDSMAAVGLINELENHFGLTFQDEELSGAAFANVGSLCDLVTCTLSRQDT